MDQDWTETPSGKKLSSILREQMTTETFDSYSLAHQNSLSSALIGLAKTKTQEDIAPEVVKGTIQMEEQMHGLAVY